MAVPDPMMIGFDPGLKFDIVACPFESNVCERLIESALLPRQSSDASSTGAVNPSTLNQRNATAAEKIYSPLGPGTMRLLKLHRGIGKIHCSVLIISEDSVLNYEALSYVWGSQENPQSIMLDGLDYLVSRNLFEALLRLRKLNQDRLLWVDALVINQSDLDERATEVIKILKRYSCAARTLVWLGEPLENSSYGRLDIVSAVKFLSGPDAKLPDRSKEEQGEAWTPIKQAVEAIFCSRYFTRSWVVQEIMYSDHITMHYGSVSIDMQDFLRFVDVDDHTVEAPCGRSLVVGDKRLSMRPGSGRQEKYLRIPSWLGCYLHNRDCENPRDCVFAYHGCFSPEARKFIVVDYERSPIEMARDITWAWIASEKNLDFLLEVGCRKAYWVRPKEPGEQCIPTWMPNYFGKQDNCTGRVYAGPIRSGFSPPRRDPIVSFNKENNAMYVKAVLLGTVESIGTMGYQPILHFEPFQSFLLGHLVRSRGKIDNLDPALREAIRVHYPKDEFLKAMKQHPAIVETLKEELEPEGESLSERNERHLRISEALCSFRVAFRYKQSAGSRPIQCSRLDVPFGLGTPDVKVGDHIFAVVGCSTPLILRFVGNFHVVVGNSKVFGFLDGYFLQNFLERFPPGIFENITLR